MIHYGWTWAHFTCKVDDATALAHYLENGGDVNARTLGLSPDTMLVVASRFGCVECATLLLAQDGCELEGAAGWAIQSKSLTIVDLLLDCGYVLTAPDMAWARSPVFFLSLLDRFDGDLAEVFAEFCQEYDCPPACVALLGRRGVCLDPPPGAADYLCECLAEASALVPPGCHPLDHIADASEDDDAVEATGMGTASFGLTNLAVEIGAVGLPEWVHVFPRTMFQRSKPIGSGGYGAVYKADLHGMEVAVKIVSPAQLADSNAAVRQAAVRRVHEGSGMSGW